MSLFDGKKVHIKENRTESPWTWPESKSAAPEGMEVKSAGGPTGESLVGFLQDTDNWDLSFAILIEYYQRCAPFGDAVNKITEAFSNIVPKVWDRQTEDYVNHPVLELLAYPNDSMEYSDFATQLCGMYLITGNPFIDIIGSVRREPLSLDVLNPQFSDIQPDSAGDMKTIKFQSEFNNTVYKADMVRGRTRYRSGNELEVWPMFAFNPNRGSRRFYGVPIAKPLYYDIEQYISSGKHNKSLLQKGARPSGSFVTKYEQPLTDEQFRRLQDQIDLYYVGAGNAGRPFLMEHAEYQEHIVNNRDMDYKTLVQNSTSAIYRQYNIPLPLVLAETMSYDNYNTAQIAKYDEAVLPVTKFIFGQLGMALFYRYGDDWRRYKLTYDETEIPALQLRKHQSVKEKASIGVNTTNELRQDIGYAPIDGGDSVIVKTNDTTLESVDSSDSNSDE